MTRLKFSMIVPPASFTVDGVPSMHPIDLPARSLIQISRFPGSVAVRVVRCLLVVEYVVHQIGVQYHDANVGQVVLMGRRD